jgi:hypothetical protein
MPLETIHNIDKGIHRLIEMYDDIDEIRSKQGRTKSRTAATIKHQVLYKEYLDDLPEAYRVASEWWEECVEAQVNQGLSQTDALYAAFERRVAGPAAAMEVVWFIRYHWLRFAALNLELEVMDRVPPQIAMLGWLVDEGHDDYVRLITCMPYWPIGLDEHGNWC